MLAPKPRLEEAVEGLATLARVESSPRKDAWEKLLGHADPIVTLDSLENAEELGAAVARRARRLRVLVEVKLT